MISPDQVKKFEYTDRAMDDIIKDIDESIRHFHGWHPWESALLNYELPLLVRNKIAKMYIKAGWKYVYHRTSSENLESMGLTSFIFSMKELSNQYCRRMHMLYTQ